MFYLELFVQVGNENLMHWAVSQAKGKGEHVMSARKRLPKVTCAHRFFCVSIGLSCVYSVHPSAPESVTFDCGGWVNSQIDFNSETWSRRNRFNFIENNMGEEKDLGDVDYETGNFSYFARLGINT